MPRRLSLWDARLIHLAGAGVLVYFLGGAWDVFWHLRLGRESFLSPPHLVLYAGLAAVFGSLGIALLHAWRSRGSGDPPPGLLRLPGGLHVDPGLFIAGLGAVMSLSSAPIDEAWHRIFGLDLTIWSPPHLQLIFGVAIAILGLMTSLSMELNHRHPERLSARLRPWRRDARVWSVFGLAALLSMALSGLIIEWDLDIPVYSSVYYPIVFAGFTVGPLMLGARAVGWRWSATAIGLVTTGLIFLLQSVFVVLASGNFVLPLSVLGGLLIDGLWQRSGYRNRPLLVAATGGLAALAMTAIRMAYMARFQHIYWPAEAWQYGLPLGVVSGAVVGLLSVRIGAALRPLAAEERAAVGRPGLVGRLAGLLALTLAMQAGLPSAVARAHGHPPKVEIAFGRTEAVVGRPVPIEVRLPESPAIRVEHLALHVSRQQRIVEPELEPTGRPGVFRSTLQVPDPGQWGLTLRIRSGHQRWIAWTFIHVTPPGVPSPHPLEAVELRTVADRTFDPAQIPVAWLWIGKISVLAYSSLLGLGVIYALRLAERDGRALIEKAAG